MSQENVEIAMRFEQAIDAREVPEALLTPDFEWFPVTMRTIEGHSYRGPEGLAAYFETVSEIWEEMSLIVDEARDLDDNDQVLILGRLQVRGRGSGIPVDEAVAVIHDLRGGKIDRVRVYLDRDEALKAVGLED